LAKISHFAESAIMLLIISSVTVYGWSNGGFSANPANPDYGTHDWIAQHSLDWLPQNEKQYVLDNLNLYLYATELPDNGQAPDGIGDTTNHHVYYFANGSLQDDASAGRAQIFYQQALDAIKAGNFSGAANAAGVMTHYVSDMAVFGHVTGSATDWGPERHHSDYEDYVNERTNSYSDEFNVFLSFDGSLQVISAYDATLQLAADTTYDTSGNGLTAVWMDANYNWDNPTFRNRAGASVNLAVNLVADVLHTIYVTTTTTFTTIPQTTTTTTSTTTTTTTTILPQTTTTTVGIAVALAIVGGLAIYLLTRRS